MKDMKINAVAGLMVLSGVLNLCGADKPNVLFIAVDDLRTELGCYGATQVKSPNIDRFASGGVLFNRAYCNVPVCGATRAILMTGIYPTDKRFVNYKTWAEKDAPGALTLAQVFKENGYTTLSNGKIFHHGTDFESVSWSEPAWHSDKGGLDALDPESTMKLSSRKRGRIYELPDVPDNAYPDGMTAEKTIADLQRLKKSGKPFFMACGFIKPHMPFYAPKKYWDLYNREDIELADNRYRPEGSPDALKGSSEFRSYYLAGLDVESDEFHRMMRHGYLACVSYTDKLVGDVLAELKRLELDDNTIVVLWGDHGWHLGEHDFWGKHNTLHQALRIPLIVKAPGKTAGRKSPSLVETVDLFPTLCDLAGIRKPAQLQGRSFTVLLDHPDEKFRDNIYSRFITGDTVLNERYSYTRYAVKGFNQMLFDHAKDPGENHCVSRNPEYAEVLKKMDDLLNARIKEARSAKW